MCMTFDCNPLINSCYFPTNLNVVILELEAYIHLVSCEPNSSYIFIAIFCGIFAGVFVKVLKYSWHLAVLLKLNFVTRFPV